MEFTPKAAFREASWLDASRARAYSTVLAIFLGLAAAWIGYGRVTRTDGRSGSDFTAFYAAGLMVRAGDPAATYDLDRFDRMERRVGDIPAAGRLPFMYPPVLLVLCGWIAALPMAWAYVAFEAVGLFPLLWCLWRQVPRRWAILPLVFAPAFVMSAGSGQTGFLSGAAFAAGVLLVGDAPGLAGLALGVLVFKPQLCVLVPVALAASRQWRALACFTASAGGLCAGAWLAVSWRSWAGFLAQSQVVQAALERASSTVLLITPMGAVHTLTGSVAAGAVTQAAASAACAALVAVGAWRAGARRGLALAAAGALLTTPFAMDYDLPVTMVPLVWVMREALQGGWRAYEKVACLAVYLLPLFCRVVVLGTGVQVAPAVLGVFLLLLWRRVMRTGLTQQRGCLVGAVGFEPTTR